MTKIIKNDVKKNNKEKKLITFKDMITKRKYYKKKYQNENSLVSLKNKKSLKLFNRI